MDAAGTIFLPDAGGGPDAGTLARLRRQRWLLGEVRDGVEAAGRRLAGQEAGAAWRSPAQRAYQDQLVELSGQLQVAWRALEDALQALDAAIDRTKAAVL